MDKSKAIMLGASLAILAGIWVVQLGLLPGGGSPQSPSPATPSGTQQHAARAGFLAWQRPDVVPEVINDPLKLDLPSTPTVSVQRVDPLPDPTAAQTHEEDGDTVNIHTQRQGSVGAPVQLDDTTPVFYVKGIVYSESNRSSVLIDQSLLHVGDEVHGALLAKITRRTVSFEKNDKTYVVRVGEKQED